MLTFGEQQERDRLMILAARYCWLTPDGSPLPKTMRPKLAAVGIVVPDEVNTTGEFVDHFDPRGHYLAFL